MSDGGKGSKPRPFSVTQEEYDNRWDTIFGRDLKEQEKREKALDEMVRISQEMGLYDDELTLEMPGTIGGAKVTFKEDKRD
mgnify:FL=1|jgi:hypothetical protein